MLSTALLAIYKHIKQTPPNTKQSFLKTINSQTVALGIVADSPQPDAGGARTWNVKPDPQGNAQIKTIKNNKSE